MARRGRGQYPDNWREIARLVKEAAGWRCARCGHEHDPASGHTPTVHHATMDKSALAWYLLWPLCQRCHLSVQARVNLDRPWLLAEHSAWARPYVAGWYAAKYLGLHLSRPEVMARLDELLALERRAYGMGETA